MESDHKSAYHLKTPDYMGTRGYRAIIMQSGGI